MQDEMTMSFRLSPQQELLWSLEPDGPVGAGRVTVAVDGVINVDRTRQALSLVVERHEILRTTFARQKGMKAPLQVVRDALVPAWELVDLGDLTPDAQQRLVAEAEAAIDARSWDYAEGPLVSARLFSLARDRFVLVLAVAPPCADGGSLITIVRELATQYAGTPAAVEPLQYADFAEWQHHLGSPDDDDGEAGRQFWLEGRAGAPTLLPFMRPAAPTTPKTVDVPLSAATEASLAEAAREYGATAAALVQAAWHIVLWKLTGEDQVVVATVPVNRAHDELETAVGAFARPFPLVSHPSADAAVGEFAAQLVRSRELAEGWQDYAPPTGADAVVGFVETQPFGPLEMEGATLSFRSLSPGSAPPVTLEWDGSACRLRFEPATLDRATAQRTARQVGVVLASIAVAPQTLLDELDLLDGDELVRLTVDVNPAATPIRGEAVHELFAAAAKVAGNRTAVVDEAGALTYAELDARTNRLAHRLRRAGAGPGSVVGLCTDRSREMIVGLLGILKTGGAYLPLNFEHPEARLGHQLREAGVEIVVTQEALLERLPDLGGEVVCLDRDGESLAGEPATPPGVTVTPENLAYVMYTSGSTGTPKGVGVTHENLVNYVQSVGGRLGATEQPLAFGMVTAISTDLGNTAVFPALCLGGTLVLVSPAAAADGAAAAAFLRHHPIDVLKITPSHLNALLVGTNAAGVLPRRWLVVGGEALSWDLVARVRELCECRILNHYGPTETTIGSCTFIVESEHTPVTATVPIGTPVANTACYVLDERGRCLPEGVAGELHIAGAGVARGYVGRDDLTEERFLPDPFVPGRRMYATGDLVRRLPEGALEFLGRRDDQIKIRGFRVEPAEIEAALRAHDAVAEATVVSGVDSRGEPRLAAYVVTSAPASPDDLRRHLADWVPEFMVPASIVVLDSLPRTASGKVDRLALPSADSVLDAPTHVYVAPRTPVEDAVAAIWADVLGLERVGVEDDFFALGGHSLLATQIVAQVRSDFSINLPLHALFSSPTVATLSQQIVELMGESSDGDTEQLLAELEGLSPEEVERLLAADEGEGSPPA
jgi:amino acid adenylation domain-containing protein